MVVPVALSLKARQYRIMPKRFLVQLLALEVRITNHKITDNDCHLNTGLPHLILALPTMLLLRRIIIRPFLTVRLDPLKSAPVFSVRENLFLKPPRDFGHIHILVSHTQIFLKEVRITNRTSNTH